VPTVVIGMTSSDSRNTAAPAGTFKVAAIQYRAVPSDTILNIRCLSELVREAALNGAKIIVLPELCTTGLNIQGRAAAENLAETIPGPATLAFAELARRYRVHLVLGLAESDLAADTFYNAQILLGPDGVIIGKYRKMHLFGPDLNWAAIGGSGYRSFDTEWGRLGLGICCDINYWELIDFLSAVQVDIFTFSTNWVGDELPFAYWSEMVAGGNYYLIAANNWGDEGEIHFSGGSTILAPDLSVLCQCYPGADCIIYADIAPPHLLPELASRGFLPG
jgi:predicted amidohydrolase